LKIVCNFSVVSIKGETISKRRRRRRRRRRFEIRGLSQKRRPGIEFWPNTCFVFTVTRLHL